MALRKTDFQHPAKGGHPCFCLPACCNCPVALLEFVTCFRKIIKLRIGKFQKVQLQQGKQIIKYNLLRKCGLLAHTSAAFLKNCCTEKLFISPAACPRKTSCIRFGKIASLFALRLVSCNHSSIKKPLCEFLSHSDSSSHYFIPYKFLTCPVLPRFHWYPATFLPVHNHPAMLLHSRSMHKHHFLHGSDSVR